MENIFSVMMPVTVHVLVTIQTYIIKDIDAKTLFTSFGIKDESGLKWALDRLPDADNDITRLKEFCDENNISYYYKMED